MKQLTIYALIVFLLLSCGRQQSTKDSVDSGMDSNKSISESALMPSEQLIDKLCTVAIDPESGDFIKSDEAYGLLEQYKAERRRTVGPGYDATKDIYGFVFGINKLKELIQRIDKINAAKKDSLVGIRVYYTRSMRFGSAIPDVLLIPVSPKKENIYPIDDDLAGAEKFAAEQMMILDTSVPCPNKCNQ